jgi:hypothetical protein
MAPNQEERHILVLPEDDANRQLANGFHLQVLRDRQRQMQVLRVAGGRDRVLRLFQAEHATEMRECKHRYMVLLIDFDNDAARLQNAQAMIPEDLRDRVFILGSWSNPEALKRAELGSYEDIGSKMAQDCREETNTIWGHELLRHNTGELDRLREHVRPILFEAN